MDNIALEHLRESKNKTIGELINLVRALNEEYIRAEGYTKYANRNEDFIYGIEKAIYAETRNQYSDIK